MPNREKRFWAIVLSAVLLLANISAQAGEADSMYVCSDWASLKACLQERMAAGECEATVALNIEECADMAPAQIAQRVVHMLALLYVNVEIYSDSDAAHFSLVCYPGQRIAAAWASGDASALTEQELVTMRAAQEIIDAMPAGSDMERERYLHDVLCRRLRFNGGEIYFDIDDGVPRYLTAIGALLDGSANCQGYTDAFYLLGTMAGLKVDYQFGTSDGELHHWNTVCLDGNWYIVDVTADDANGNGMGEEWPNYSRFNLGADCMGQNLSWTALDEIQTIASTDEHYFYYADGDTYGKAFTDLDRMALWIYAHMREQGRAVCYTLIDAIIDRSALSERLKDLTGDYPRDTAWNVFVTNDGGYSYCITNWTQF